MKILWNDIAGQFIHFLFCNFEVFLVEGKNSRVFQFSILYVKVEKKLTWFTLWSKKFGSKSCTIFSRSHSANQQIYKREIFIRNEKFSFSAVLLQSSLFPALKRKKKGNCNSQMTYVCCVHFLMWKNEFQVKVNSTFQPAESQPKGWQKRLFRRE